MTVTDPRAGLLGDAVEVVVRCAEAADAVELAAFHEEVQADGEGVVGRPGEHVWTVESEEAWIERHRATDDWLAVVAMIDGEFIGLLGFEVGDRARLRHQGEFGLWIRPSWRGRGAGTLLLTELITWADDRGIERIGLTVLSTAERAIALYRKLGFREEGRRIRQVKFASGEYADQVLMALFPVGDVDPRPRA
ncbi:MAG: GNAT family N-acetyltransferase [Planctomycetes bacterium]|nr:GNAT family N-acetyltransferase [Planctomycetota bacterium]